MKKTIIVLVFLFALGIFYVGAQDYKTSIGIRGGWTSGITGKYFIKEGKAIEALLTSGYRYRGFQLTALYEIHKPAFKDKVDGLFWFYGGGLHVGGGYRYEHWHPNSGLWGWGTYHQHNYVAFGIDGIFGIEFKIPDIPFTVGADVKPFFDFVTDRDAPYGFFDSALSIRYVF